MWAVKVKCRLRFVSYAKGAYDLVVYEVGDEYEEASAKAQAVAYLNENGYVVIGSPEAYQFEERRA